MSSVANGIPIDQAAYQAGRSTTEQVFSVKVLCEKAIAAQKLQVDIKMSDMSKAFDTISRKLLFQHLEKDIEPDELYYLSILTNKPELKVRVGAALADPFQTLAGIMQGDCLSAVLFIYYLGKALNTTSIKIVAESEGVFYIEPKYADDITSVTVDDVGGRIMDKVDAEHPAALKKYHLQCNPSKTENHAVPPKTITLPPNPNCKAPCWSEMDWIVKPNIETEPATWKSCKLLGSRLDTETDIKCRKARACQIMNDLSEKFKSKYLSIQTKIKEFNTYVKTIFMYNSELWALNKTSNKSIDSFHRRLLREAINRKWPKSQYTNEELYNITKEEPWSETIRRRRMKWTGHLMRLNTETPARIALRKFAEPQKNKVGRPKQTWLATVRTDLKDEIDTQNKDNAYFISRLEGLASDRKEWKGVVNRVCETVRKD